MHELLRTYEYNKKNIQNVLDYMQIGTGAEVFRHKSSIIILNFFIHNSCSFDRQMRNVLKVPILKGRRKLID